MWILLEGLDRTGKSSVAEHFKKDGFEVVHLSAPDKKYQDEFYVGSSYLDEMVDLMMAYDGKNVVFDRTWYGEFIWPHVYGRKAQLTEEDIEILQEFESRNDTQRFLMIDPNTQEHWRRCVENKEPINQSQFKIANQLYARFAHKYNFIPRSLHEFNEKLGRTKDENSDLIKTGGENQPPVQVQGGAGVSSGTITLALPVEQAAKTEGTAPVQEKLEKANAINSILSKRIIKARGDMFDNIEADIRTFLGTRLSELMGTSTPKASLSDDEVQILKTLCKQWQAKLKEKT